MTGGALRLVARRIAAVPMAAASGISAVIDKSLTFESFGLDARVLKAVRKMGLEHPSLIQAKCIPLALEGKDVLSRARTGSGKTLAYAAPLVHRVLRAKEEQEHREAEPPVRALILVPTRELSEQVRAVIEALAAPCHGLVRVANVAGDLPAAAARAKLAEGPDVVVSTPGYLAKILASVDLTRLAVVVLDEADLLLSYGYEEDLRAVAQRLPRGCQGLLMSATLSADVERLKKLVLHAPVVLRLEEPEAESALLKEHSVAVSGSDKFLVLYALLSLRLVRGKALIFVNSIARCFRLKLFLGRFGIAAAVLNSDLPFNCRYHAVQEFNRGAFQYLIATDLGDDERDDESDAEPDAATEEAEDAAMDTAEPGDEEEEAGDEEEEGEEVEEEEEGGEEEDEEEEAEEEEKGAGAPKERRGAAGAQRRSEYSAARGVDFKEVAAVINFDLPRTAKAYVHRVGRAGRGVTSGVAITFVTQQAQERYGTIAAERTEAGRTIAPYALDMRMLEGLRYRVSDVMRSISHTQVRRARLLALKEEIANSRKLREHFGEGARELAILRGQLRHDKELLQRPDLRHLRDVPTYLLPQELVAAPPLAPLPQRVPDAAESEAAQQPLNKNKRRREELKKKKKALRQQQQEAGEGAKPEKKRRRTKLTPQEQEYRHRRNQRNKRLKKLARQRMRQLGSKREHAAAAPRPT